MFLREIFRILKQGGYTVFATPNLAACYNIAYLLFGKQPYIAHVSDNILAGSWMPLKRLAWGKKEGPAHRRVFTLGALKELLEYHGFTTEKALGCGFFPQQMIKSSMGRSQLGRGCKNMLLSISKLGSIGWQPSLNTSHAVELAVRELISQRL